MNEVGAGLLAYAARVRLVVLDVDGVLTDGSLWYGEQGEVQKRFHVRDGMGVRLLQHFGIQVAVISARASKLVGARMSDLKIAHWVTGQDDKVAAIEKLARELTLDAEQMAFLGDDILDVPGMRAVGLPVAVADAHPCARAVARYVTNAVGGNGAVREVADLVLDAQLGRDRAYTKFLEATCSSQRSQT